MNKLFISQPMTGYNDDEIRAYRQRVKFLVSVMINDPNLELIEQFDVDEAPMPELNVNQLRQFRLHRSLEFMREANIIVFAPGWWKSPGCIQEYIERKLYMRGALVIFGNKIQEAEVELYGGDYNEYDFTSEKVVMDAVDNLLKTITKPDKIKLDIPSIVFPSKEIQPRPINELDVPKILSFRDYVSQYSEADASVGIMLQETLSNFLLEETVAWYGQGNSKVTPYTDAIGDKLVYTLNIQPKDSNLAIELEAALNNTIAENEEWRAISILIKAIPKDNYAEEKVIIAIDFIPSQVGPETDDRISNTVSVAYIGSPYTPKDVRHIMSNVHRKFKQFVNARTDINWKKV